MDDADFAAFSVIPADGDLAKAQTSAVSEKEKLNIERESLNACSFQNRATNIETERLKPALCVPNRHSSRTSYEQVENAASLFASPGLMNADQFAVERTRTKGKIDISVRDRLDHLWDFPERCRKIGIKK